MAYNRRDDKRDVTFEIKERYGVLSETESGWTKELNLVSWNGTKAKFDLREWSPDHTRMSKGLTFNHEEMAKVKEMLATAI